MGDNQYYKIAIKIRDFPLWANKPYVKELIKTIYFMTIFHEYNPRIFIISDKLRIAYLINYKVAYISIITTLAKKEFFGVKKIPKEVPLHKLPWKVKHKLSKNDRKYFSFTFVRNPFDRVVSFYFNRVKNEKYPFIYLFKRFSPHDSFESVVKKIYKIPDWLADNHFKSQYSIVYHKGEQLVEFIGRFENIEKDWEVIRKKVSELPKLPKLNVSKKKKDWREYYTPELAKLVYKRYKKDFETWYPNAYDELMDYLEKKKKS